MVVANDIMVLLAVVGNLASFAVSNLAVRVAVSIGAVLDYWGNEVDCLGIVAVGSDNFDLSSLAVMDISIMALAVRVIIPATIPEHHP